MQTKIDDAKSGLDPDKTNRGLTSTAFYGWFIKPIGWSLALLVWGYAFVWFFINNITKRLVLHYLSGTVLGEKSPPISEVIT